MARYQTSVDTKWDVARTFAYMAAFENVAQWDPGVRRAERKTPGDVGLGTEFLVISVFNDREIPLTYRITEYDVDKRVVLEATTSTMASRDVVTVVEHDGGTRMTYDANFSFRGWLWLANPLLRSSFQKIGDHARDGLRRELAKD